MKEKIKEILNDESGMGVIEVVLRNVTDVCAVCWRQFYSLSVWLPDVAIRR